MFYILLHQIKLNEIQQYLISYWIFPLMKLFPNSSLAVLMLDMLGFNYCHIECQDFIQMQLKIQNKL